MALNIAQIEFFHVGGAGVSLNELHKECAERVADNRGLASHGHDTGPGIKTVVRFFDETGYLTKIAMRMEKVVFREKQLISRFSATSTSLRQIWIEMQWNRLSRLRRMLKKEMTAVAIRSLHKAFRGERSVAIECADHSFRFVRPEEVHELITTTSPEMVKDVWVFVFAYNNLLSDKNTPVASVSI